MTVTPLAQISQFLHFFVIMLYVVFDGQAARVEDPDIAA